MLHKHFVIFRSIYYTRKLNKQINNGPAELFSISYLHQLHGLPAESCLLFFISSYRH